MHRYVLMCVTLHTHGHSECIQANFSCCPWKLHMTGQDHTTICDVLEHKLN